MFIDVVRKDAVKIDYTTQEKKLYTIEWNNLIENNKNKMISEFIFFDCSLELKYKKIKKEPKLIFLGEYNDKFWFFKIIKKINKNKYVFEIKKPVYDSIKSIKVFIIDWYDVVKELKINEFVIEYAVSKK